MGCLLHRLLFAAVWQRPWRGRRDGGSKTEEQQDQGDGRLDQDAGVQDISYEAAEGKDDAEPGEAAGGADPGQGAVVGAIHAHQVEGSKQELRDAA